MHRKFKRWILRLGTKMIQQATFMNDVQINKARREGELVICPYSDKKLTPVGYNLSFSRFIVSLRKRAFVKIKHRGNEWYFDLKPHETVLVWTRESIWVSRFIGGTFHSKVSLVTRGLGHVSTTLDPGWHGQLLVPLNNPTKENIKVIIARDKEFGKEFETFITMVLFRAQEASLNEKGDNKSARVELLETILEQKKRNRDAQYLWDFIQRIKKSVNGMDIFVDLNDPTDRKCKIDQYQREHLKMIAEMDAEFDRLNQFSAKMYNWRRFIFWGIVAVIFGGMLGVTIYINLTQNATWRSTINGCAAIMTSLLLWILQRVADKYI